MTAIRTWIASLTLLAAVIPSGIVAQPDLSRTISYQGLLAGDAASARVPDGLYHLAFRLYSDSIGNHAIWRDTYTVDVRGGVFSVLLGSGAIALPPSTELDRQLWLGVALEETPEFRPLSPLSAAPYALNVPDSSITTSKIVDHAVTEDKLAVQYVRGVSVNGYSVTASGSNHFVNFRSKRGIELTFEPTDRMVDISARNLIWTAPVLFDDMRDLDIEANARVIRVIASRVEGVTLTGINHTGIVNGQLLTVRNIGVNPIRLEHASPKSNARDQFTLPGNGHVIIAAGGSADLLYDEDNGHWVFLSGN